MSRVNSARIAAIKAEHAGLWLRGAVMASDAFFPLMVLIMRQKLALNALFNRVVLCAMKKHCLAADEAGIVQWYSRVCVTSVINIS